MVTNMGKGMFLGQSRHCICPSVSRGLSAAAEFLVLDGLVGDICNILEKISLESFLGAEMTFYGHSKSSEMARFDREVPFPIVL